MKGQDSRYVISVQIYSKKKIPGMLLILYRKSKLSLTYNPFLKMTCWKIAGQFVRQGKFYRTIYEQAKEKYNLDISVKKGHADNRARRYTVKLFLSHLHEQWSKSEGREVKEFYYKSFGDFSGHTYIEPPYKDIF